MHDPSWLAPTTFVDSDHPHVIAFAREVCGEAETTKERATRLFRAVRERFRYDPYSFSPDPSALKASSILAHDRAWCVPKAVVLCAAARAVGIPARLGFADVRNHLASEKLLRVLGTDLFVFHGYVELVIDGANVLATPAFNAALCERFGVPVLELDGVHDAMLQAFDAEGRRHMEYVRDRGRFTDLPYDAIMAAFREHYTRGIPRKGEEGAHDEVFQG
jgi:transglutaminase-like putative cysteine protease